MDFQRRKQKLVETLGKREKKIDCVLITTLANLKYYFDYGGASYERFCVGLISLKERKTALVIPKLDEGKSASSSVDGVFPWTDSNGYKGALEEALQGIGSSKAKLFGCEDWITLSRMEEIRKVRAQAKFESVSQNISNQRLVKSEDEIEAIRNSTRKLTKGYEKIPSILKQGQTEIDASFEIKKALVDVGVAEADFCAVQSGPNSSVPHSLPSSRKLATGDMIVIDISCLDETGYYADFTRTFSVGRAGDEQRQVYGVVKEAQSTGVKTASPGIPAKTIDREVRSVIGRAGFGEYFIHRTGHGIGLEVHEPPWISDSNSSKLKEGMVFTIEPGVYIPGKFGVRIEDNVALNSSGNENMTQVTHDLVEI